MVYSISSDFMQLAISEAKKAEDFGEVPIGAVIAINEKVIAKGYNKDSINHAEIVAIQKAIKKLGCKNLTNATIYITLEPCPMCAFAICLAKISNVVFGTHNRKTGAFGSKINILNSQTCNHTPNIYAGYMEQECQAILTDFFNKKRNNKQITK